MEMVSVIEGEYKGGYIIHHMIINKYLTVVSDIQVTDLQYEWYVITNVRYLINV